MTWAAKRSVARHAARPAACVLRPNHHLLIPCANGASHSGIFGIECLPRELASIVYFHGKNTPNQLIKRGKDTSTIWVGVESSIDANDSVYVPRIIGVPVTVPS